MRKTTIAPHGATARSGPLAAPAAARITDDAGRRTGEEIALLHMARAWTDRWRAAGGNFGLLHGGDGKPRMMFGRAESCVWEPTDQDRDDLPPHVRLTEPEHQAGAIRALEAMLVLVPNLREAVSGVVGVQLLAAPEREA